MYQRLSEAIPFGPVPQGSSFSRHLPPAVDSWSFALRTALFVFPTGSLDSCPARDTRGEH